MKILITGAFGYVGYSVVEQMLIKAQDTEFILYDNMSRKNLNFFFGNKLSIGSNRIKVFNNDILDNYHLKKAMIGIDAVIHLAAKASTPFADHNAHGFDQVNNWGTACVVDAIASYSNCKRIIHLSSTSVYGHTDSESKDETGKTDPKTFYGISKLNAEKHVLRLKEKTECFIIRSANVIGYSPCMRLDAVFNKFAFEAHYFKKLTIHGNGQQMRAFLEVNNLASVISDLALGLNNAPPQVYNLVDYNLTIQELCEENQKLNPGLEFNFVDQNFNMRSTSIHSNYNYFEKYLGKKSPFELISQMKQNFSIQGAILS